jgi:eukaryotic-like serine/threonine-protein kinase
VLLCPRCGDAYRVSRLVCPVDGTMLVSAAEVDPRLSTVLGNYRLVDLLGKGGMGVVYLAEHVYMGTPAAIKILHDRHAGDREAITRMLQEARAAASIGHANVVDVMDFGETPEGSCYFVMEHVDGQPLDQIMEDAAPLPLIRAINIINQIGLGVGAAHERGIIHRDLKPENIIVAQRPGRRRIVHTEWKDGEARYNIDTEASWDFVKVLDFGVAKVLDRDSKAHQTIAGHVIGTPDYMAPETARGKDFDHRVDIYALGVMFFELVTGCRPFEAEGPVEVMIAHCSHPVPSAKKRNPQANISDAADRLIARAMAKLPDQRPATMEHFLAELQVCYGDERFYRTVADELSSAARGASQRGHQAAARSRSLTEDLRDLFGRSYDIVEPALDVEPVLLTKKK